jgi:hypothetical protein
MAKETPNQFSVPLLAISAAANIKLGTVFPVKEMVSVYQLPVYCVVSYVLMNGTVPTCFAVEDEFML